MHPSRLQSLWFHPHLPWLLNARHSLCGWWIVIGPHGPVTPRQDAPSPLFFLRASSFLSVPALPLKDAGLCLKDDSSSHTASCGLQASFPRCQLPQRQSALYLPEMLKAEIHHFLFIPETKEFIIYL